MTIYYSRNILVDVSWRFTTAIIIDCIAFILILSCLILAIRSYNKNVAGAEKAAVALPTQQIEMTTKNINNTVIESGLKDKKLIENDKFVDANKLEQAINDNNIIISKDKDGFIEKYPGIDFKQYGEVIEGWIRRESYFFRIKKSFNITNLI